MNEKTISGSYVAEATEKFAFLTIAPEAVLAAPAGKCLTLTVDGVNRQIEPGTYTGDVVLTVSDAVQVDYENHGKVDHFEMANAVVISDGKYVPEKSVSAAADGFFVHRILSFWRWAPGLDIGHCPVPVPPQYLQKV